MSKPQPGDLCDNRGVPIHHGDLLKIPHFVGARRKRYWHYHVAVYDSTHGVLELVPVSELEPTLQGRGGRCWLTVALAAKAEVIAGSGPGEILDFDDRPKQKEAT